MDKSTSNILNRINTNLDNFLETSTPEELEVILKYLSDFVKGINPDKSDKCFLEPILILASKIFFQ